MYEQVLTYITAIAPSLATVITAILMFVKIIAATRDMTVSLRKETETKLDTLNETVRQVTESNELKQIKEQYRECMAQLEQLTRQNAELIAQLNQRGY